jgi:HK97 family phage portal protein
MVRHFKQWVYVAVDRIATAVAMNPPNVSYLLTDTSESLGKSKPRNLTEQKAWFEKLHRQMAWRQFHRSKALTPLQAHEDLLPVEPDHALSRLLADPNDPDTSYDLWYETAMYLLITGNAYWWVPPLRGTSTPAAIWVLPSHWMVPQWNRDGSIEKYDLRPVEGAFSATTIPATDVIHFRRKSPVSKHDGYGALTAGASWVDTQEAMDRSRWFSFRNGIFPGVSIEFDAGIRIPDEADLDRIEARIMSRYGGEHNSNRPMFVPPGAKLKPMSLSPKELAYAESTDQLRDQILALFGVPASIAQVNSSMTYGSILAAHSSFYMLTLNPICRYFGQVLTEKLANRYPGRLKIWWEDRTPTDPELQEKQFATDSLYHARTPNELRASRGLAPLPDWWYDQPWASLNSVPASLAVDFFQRQQNTNANPTSSVSGSSGLNEATASDPDNVATGNSSTKPRPV